MWLRLKIVLILLIGASFSVLPPGVSLLQAQSFSRQSLDPQKSMTQYVHRYWGEEEGLPQSSINAIAQTDDGYLWLGTQEGLVRFDGIYFKLFDKSNVDVISSSDIRVLTTDNDGALWIGTRDGGILRYEAGAFFSITAFESLKSARITAIEIDEAEDILYVGTAEKGVWTYHNNRVHHLDEISVSTVSSLELDANGALWVGTRTDGLLQYQDKAVRAYPYPNSEEPLDITALTYDASRDVLWVGTRDHGLYTAGEEFLLPVAASYQLPSSNILSLYVDGNQTLWVGTNLSGLVRVLAPASSAWDGTEAIVEISSFMSSEGLSNDVVKTLFTDREGNLLIGTDGGGLNMLRESKFTTYTIAEGLIDDFVFSVHGDVTGAMWFSTEKGVSRLDETGFTTYTRDDGLATEFVTSISSTADSSVWFGTYGGGLSRYKDGVFTSYTLENGLPDESIFALYTDSRDVLWIGTGGGIAQYADDRFKILTEEEGLTSNLVTTMIEGKSGGVWVGTYNAGLNWVKAGQVFPFSSEHGLSNDAVLSLYRDSDDVLWVGTYGGGLNRVEDGEVTVFTMKEGLFNDNIVHIVEDDEGDLWMSCNRGLFRVSKQELNAFSRGEIDRITSIVFDKSDGLKSQEFNGGIQPAGWKSRDGQLWFPTSKGVASIHPDQIVFNENPPPVYIEEILIDGKSLSAGKDNRLDPGLKKIQFQYVGLSMVAPEKTTYRFRLEGVDDEWVEAGTRRTAYYTNLDHGAYTFQVIAENGDGIASEQAAIYTFYVRPFFYETLWFYIISGSLLALCVFGAYKYRVSIMRERERELNRLVEDRTRTLEKRTAELLGALEQNKEIMGITSHDLKNPLGGIIGLADMLLEDLGMIDGVPEIEEGIENVELMKGEAERMLRIIKDLLDKHREEEQSIVKKTPVNVMDLVEDVLRWNSQKAKDKNITITFSYSDAQIVYADADALLRVIDNLVSNAVKYSPPGRKVWVVLSEIYDEVLFQVLDEGPGLTEEDLTKVFGKMQRLSAKPTAGEHSTGLGLYIVKQLIEEHGGEVGVNSVYGEGATFWFKLPVHKEEGAEKVAASLGALEA